MPDPEGGPGHLKKSPGLIAVGIAIVLIGLVILVPSGLCTAVFGIASIGSAIRSGQWSGLLFVIGIGIVPVVVGALTTWAGIQILRGK
jgi:hypothetical protein